MPNGEKEMRAQKDGKPFVWKIVRLRYTYGGNARQETRLPSGEIDLHVVKGRCGWSGTEAHCGKDTSLQTNDPQRFHRGVDLW